MSDYETEQDIKWALRHGPLRDDQGRPYGYGVLARHLDMNDPVNVHYVHRAGTGLFAGHSHYVYEQEVARYRRTQERYRKMRERDERLATPAGRILHLLAWPFTAKWHFAVAAVVALFLGVQAFSQGSGEFEWIRPYVVGVLVVAAVAAYAFLGVPQGKKKFHAKWDYPLDVARTMGLHPPR